MAKKTRIFEINTDEKGFISKLRGEEETLNLEDVKLLRNLLSNEKARILYTIKEKAPESIYHLAKLLTRDIKSVRKDVAILHRFGFIEFSKRKKGKRILHRPALAVERMELILKI